MHPILFQIEAAGITRTFTTYGVMAVIGIFTGALLSIRIAKKRGYNAFDFTNIIALLVAGGIVVSLFTHFLIFLPERLAAPSFWEMQWGVVSWGGVVGGFLAALYASRAWKIPLLRLGDIVIPGVALGFAFGRLGCFFAGCCYGLHYDGLLHLTFTHPLAPAAMEMQPLFPIQPLSAALLFALCLILLWVVKKQFVEGMAVVVYAILYSIGRFTIEFFRNDPRGIYLHLSDAQWYSLFLFTVGVLLWFYLSRRGKKSAPHEENYGH
ncbi:MAG TPA: prolipoprotein diacylglyceryl transferase [Turneriella sp.]|nr:prolipoprotein diacylglyceryl transferase [Turneriella sp.]